MKTFFVVLFLGCGIAGFCQTPGECVEKVQGNLALRHYSPVHNHPISDTLLFRRFFAKKDPKSPWVVGNLKPRYRKKSEHKKVVRGELL